MHGNGFTHHGQNMASIGMFFYSLPYLSNSC